VANDTTPHDEAMRLARIYEAREARRRELIAWLNENDMHGLECAQTVELEHMHYESNTGQHAEILARALLKASTAKVALQLATARLTNESDSLRAELAASQAAKRESVRMPLNVDDLATLRRLGMFLVEQHVEDDAIFAVLDKLIGDAP